MDIESELRKIAWEIYTNNNDEVKIAYFLIDDDVDSNAQSLNTDTTDSNIVHNECVISTKIVETLCFNFETLLSIFMYMFYYDMSVNRLNDLMAKNIETHDDEKIDSIEIDDYIGEYHMYDEDRVSSARDNYQQKFFKYGIYLHIGTISVTDFCQKYVNTDDCYCMIYLHGLHKSTNYFLDNGVNPDEQKFIFCKINHSEFKNKKLSDFYALCWLPNVVIKISFDTVL